MSRGETYMLFLKSRVWLSNTVFCANLYLDYLFLGFMYIKKDSEWYCHRPQSQQNDSSTVLHCRIDQIPWNMQYLLVFSQSLCISERSPIRYCICKDIKYNMHAHCCQIQLNVNEYCQPNTVHVSDGQTSDYASVV